MADPLRHVDDSSPISQRVGIPTWVKLMLVAELVVLVAAFGVYALLHRPDDRENVVNQGLRGSRPPAGQTLPDLSKVDGITPALQTPVEMRGDTTLYVATCMKCASGDIVGGALRRLSERDLPEGARIEAIVWQGDVDAWKRSWGIPDSLPIHVVTGAESIGEVKVTLGIGDNGFAYLYDGTGRWRASYAVQLMQPDDIVHDMEQLTG